MGRPGCEQCCGKPEPARCLSCLHACQYAVVNDPALLDKYWTERVYQPTGFEGDPADFRTDLPLGADVNFNFTARGDLVGYTWGYNATRAYTSFDPEVHPCNEDKFEYIVEVLNCQNNAFCIPNGDFDVCVNGENLGTYLGYDPLNPEVLPTFEGLPLYPYTSKYNNPLKCGGVIWKATVFGTSQEAIDFFVGNKVHYNTYVVPKDPFLMDARDIVIDQSGNPSFGPKGGSFDIRLIPNPGINNLRLDLDISLNSPEQREVLDYATFCAFPARTVAQGALNSSYPVQWTPPSQVHIIIYSLERPVANDNVTEFRRCTVANVCYCIPNGEEVCANVGLRPLCVNPFDSDNYENGEPKFISSADFNASTECTCNDDEEYEEPQSPGDPNAAPTCYYDADLQIVRFNFNSQSFLGSFDVRTSFDTEGDWKGKTREIVEYFVDNAPDSVAPFGPGSGAAIARATQDMVEDLLASTGGCPERIFGEGWAGPLVVEGGFQVPTDALEHLIFDPAGPFEPDLDRAYTRIRVEFNYTALARADVDASTIMNPNFPDVFDFDGTCCAGKGGNLTIGNTWSTNLGPLLNMNPGNPGTPGFNFGQYFNIDRCEDAIDENGDALPLYLKLDNPLAADAPHTDGVPVYESSLGRDDVTSQSGYKNIFGFDASRNEARRISPFFGNLDETRIVYTFNDLSTGEYYYNVDSGCSKGIECMRLKPSEEERNPCVFCSTFETVLDTDGNPINRDVVSYDILKGASSLCSCPQEPRDPCQPFAEDSFGCPEITNGIKEFVLDSDGNVYCGIICNTGYVLEYDDVTGCAQCVQIQCNGTCNFTWDGNTWKLNLFDSGTCLCKCEPPNIPGTFVGQHGLGTCVDDIANRVCGEGKCWWTWFVLDGGGGEWRKNAADNPFGFASTCECRCDPPPNDGNFPGDQTATLCFK